ncbi:hypothetical protein [Mycetohabitans rhizoxinica]
MLRFTETEQQLGKPLLAFAIDRYIQAIYLFCDIVATQAMFARERRRNSLAAYIACINLPRSVGHDLLCQQNTIVDQTLDHLVGDAKPARPSCRRGLEDGCGRF